MDFYKNKLIFKNSRRLSSLSSGKEAHGRRAGSGEPDERPQPRVSRCVHAGGSFLMISARGFNSVSNDYLNNRASSL